MRCFAFWISLLFVSGQLLAEGLRESEMETVAVLATTTNYSGVKSRHAFCLFNDASTASFIAFPDSVFYIHSGKEDLFKDGSVFRFRGSLEAADTKNCEGGSLCAKTGDVFLFCNQNFTHFIDLGVVEEILQNYSEIQDAARKLAEAAHAQRTNADSAFVLIKKL
jgi:hypothetical protein